MTQRKVVVGVQVSASQNVVCWDASRLPARGWRRFSWSVPFFFVIARWRWTLGTSPGRMRRLRMEATSKSGTKESTILSGWTRWGAPYKGQGE